jgi:membrane protease subunit (stomatin/prohibitin family)
MGIMDFIKGEAARGHRVDRRLARHAVVAVPRRDKAIKNGAQLIVRESQVAPVRLPGEFGDTFGPGKHTLTTDNIPVLTKIKSWPVRLQLAVQGRRLLRHHRASSPATSGAPPTR